MIGRASPFAYTRCIGDAGAAVVKLWLYISKRALYRDIFSYPLRLGSPSRAIFRFVA